MNPAGAKPKKRPLASSCGLRGKAIRYGGDNKKALAQGLTVGANTHELDAKFEGSSAIENSDQRIYSK
jgi:hypothetical protein